MTTVDTALAELVAMRKGYMVLRRKEYGGDYVIYDTAVRTLKVAIDIVKEIE